MSGDIRRDGDGESSQAGLQGKRRQVEAEGEWRVEGEIPEAEVAADGRWMRRVGLGLAAIPALTAGRMWLLIPVNRGWREPDEGLTIYLADNGITPTSSCLRRPGSRLRPSCRSAISPAPTQCAVGGLRIGRGGSISRRRGGKTSSPERSSGDRRQAREHVEWSAALLRGARDPAAPRGISRLWRRSAPTSRSTRVAARATSTARVGVRAFYRATGKASAIRTCNSWPDRLRVAGVRTAVAAVRPGWCGAIGPLRMPAKAGISGR